MLDDYIQHTMGQVDDLAELKISLAALSWLEQRHAEAASITARELAALPALEGALGFAPQIALESGLKRAVARGTLLVCESGSLDEPHYFLNNPAGRQAIDAIESADARRAASNRPPASATQQLVTLLGHEIERLELVDAYPVDLHDAQTVEEWLARGYSTDEILNSVRETLRVPRSKGSTLRGISACAANVAAQAPAAPSKYYRVVIARSEPPPDEIIAYRELAGRWPGGHEFNLVQSAVGMYGSHNAITTMKKLVSPQQTAIDDLLPLLAEQAEAEAALSRQQAQPGIFAREMIDLYENTFGLPATPKIAGDIMELAAEIPEKNTWQKVFQYAVAQNIRNWSYVSKMLRNPSPGIFMPEPVNDTARFAFGEYKRRIGHGYLDAKIAEEINALAQEVTDTACWTAGFDQAAVQNAPKWAYLRKVISNPNSGHTNEARDGRRKSVAGSRQKGVGRRAQVEESTEAEREAARERARQRIAERARRRAQGDDSGQQSGG